MNVVVLAIHLNKPGLKLCAYRCEHRPKPFDSISVQHSAPVFGHENQVDVHSADNVPTPTKFIHRPTIAICFEAWIIHAMSKSDQPTKNATRPLPKQWNVLVLDADFECFQDGGFCIHVVYSTLS